MIETSALGSVNYTLDTESCVDVPQSNYVKALIVIFKMGHSNKKRVHSKIPKILRMYLMEAPLPQLKEGVVQIYTEKYYRAQINVCKTD